MKQLIFGLSITAAVLYGGWSLIPVQSAQARAEKSGDTTNAQVVDAPFAQGPFDGQTLGVRISGLVCDLCVADITKALKKTPNVVDVGVFPRDGVVALSLSGVPDQALIRTILQSEGYRVHAFALSSALMGVVQENPKAYAETLWKGGAQEQERLMSTKEGQQATCERKKDLKAFQQTAWSNPTFSSATPAIASSENMDTPTATQAVE